LKVPIIVSFFLDSNFSIVKSFQPLKKVSFPIIIQIISNGFFFLTEPRKHWLTEDEDGFANRGATLQSSLNDNKTKNRPKKQSGGLLKGIGHMFRFGKHRKDVYPATTTEVISDYGGWTGANESKTSNSTVSTSNTSANTSNNSNVTVITQQSQQASQQQPQMSKNERQPAPLPPQYQPPPPVSGQVPVGQASPPVNGIGTRIHQNDAFNYRYPHYDVRTSNYVNTNELQHQIK
jgi:partitioning defective protein 3